MVKNAITRKGINVSNALTNIQSNCNEIVFENAGAATALISYEGITRTLLPGESFAHGSDRVENIETTVYDVAFTGAGTQNVIIERVYIKENAYAKCP